MRIVHLGAALSVLAFCSSLFADQVVLKNGDRISGAITKSDDKTLLIKTEFAGDVEIQWPAVQEINSTQPLHVTLANGTTVAGTVMTADGSMVVNAPTGTVTVVKSDVTALRSVSPSASQGQPMRLVALGPHDVSSSELVSGLNVVPPSE